MKRFAIFFGPLLALALGGCGSESAGDGLGGSETNWLEACESDESCKGESTCFCGICTQTCETDGNCDAIGGVTCAAPGDRAYEATCDDPAKRLPEGDVCLPSQPPTSTPSQPPTPTPSQPPTPTPSQPPTPTPSQPPTPTPSQPPTPTPSQPPTPTPSQPPTPTPTPEQTPAPSYTPVPLEGAFTVTNSLDLATLSDFNVVTGDLTIDVPGVSALTFETLRRVEGTIRLIERPEATYRPLTVDFPVLQHTGGLEAIGHDSITTLRFPHLRTAGRVELAQIENLTTLDMAALNGPPDLSFSVSGRDLTGVGMPWLTHAATVRVSADALEELDLSRLVHVTELLSTPAGVVRLGPLGREQPETLEAITDILAPRISLACDGLEGRALPELRHGTVILSECGPLQDDPLPRMVAGDISITSAGRVPLVRFPSLVVGSVQPGTELVRLELPVLESGSVTANLEGAPLLAELHAPLLREGRVTWWRRDGVTPLVLPAFERGELRLYNMVDVELPVLVEAQWLESSARPGAAASFAAPNLRVVHEEFEVLRFASVDLAAVEDVGESLEITLTDPQAATSLVLPNLEQIDSLFIRAHRSDGDVPLTLSLPALTTLAVHQSQTVLDLRGFDSIALPVLESAFSRIILAAAALDAPRLEEVRALELDGFEGPEGALHLPVLSSVEDLLVGGNTTSLSLPELSRAPRLRIQAPQLESLELPELETVDTLTIQAPQIPTCAIEAIYLSLDPPQSLEGQSYAGCDACPCE